MFDYNDEDYSFRLSKSTDLNNDLINNNNNTDQQIHQKIQLYSYNW